MMERTQISVDPETLTKARRKARELGVSLAEYIRRLLDRDLGGNAPGGNVTGVFNLGSSEGSDIAREKDRAIASAIASSRGDRKK